MAMTPPEVQSQQAETWFLRKWANEFGGSGDNDVLSCAQCDEPDAGR
jgi:hypothetical protein